MEQQQIGGTYGKQVKTKEFGFAKWANAPRFVAGLEKESPFLSPLPIGREMIGTFKGLKEVENAKYRTVYAYFTDIAGNNFSIQCTNQLEGLLSKSKKIEDILSITYNGMKDYKGQETCDWTVKEIEKIEELN